MRTLVELTLQDDGDFVDVVYPRQRVRLLGPGVPEALKAPHEPKVIGGKRNGITVPDGARWVWIEFANEGEDLQGEVVDLETLRRYAKYTVTEAGWIDVEHFSRPGRFPAEWLEKGVTPDDFVIGKLTDLRFSDSAGFAEGFLWPQGQNPHADVWWDRLTTVPEMVHASVGGPPLARVKETLSGGREVVRLKLLANHIALCKQAVNPHGTKVRTAPFGEFAKAVADGVPLTPDCDGEGCVPCFIRGGEVAKAVTSGGPEGLGDQGQRARPEDLEGAAVDPETEDDEQAADGRFENTRAAEEHLVGLGLKRDVAKAMVVAAARHQAA